MSSAFAAHLRQDFADDLESVFFADDGLCHPFTRQRSGVADITVYGIFDAADEEALDGRILAAHYTLLLRATADVQGDDILQANAPCPAQGIAQGARFVLLEAPRRIGDGAQMLALLGSVP